LAQEMLGITAAKVELPRRVKRLESGELERIVIMKRNSPVAVILTVGEYDRMRQFEELTELREDLTLLVQAMEADDGSRIDLDDVKRKLGIS
jgi:prevent-host-death family protein